MGRELQKRKNRSSVPKVKRKPKRTNKILSNPIIRANWNPKETLTQNYRRLGLTSRLNHTTGGLQKTAASLPEPGAIQPEDADPLAINPRTATAVNTSEIRIERDPETGAILRVLDEKTDNPLNDPLNDLDDEYMIDSQALMFSNVPTRDGEETTETVRALEEKAASGVRKAPRKLSQRESEWVAKLVERHGDDYRAMTRDMKLNPFQNTEGELKRKVKKLMEQRAKSGTAEA
ncbi:60S ribosomal subunit biogenesis protein-like protein Nop16 [Trichodelitschia bisporula]|uniref:Nucleolar protein 16 n=1 Tax=Trichodelitschia bisporula TaxID=703511 RepID=A0A6G1HPJ9_9PEZI|nr:60S ribosomal subunit biogenesis protein-like protein Nop16 [Trichodelitschia bisporula]